MVTSTRAPILGIARRNEVSLSSLEKKFGVKATIISGRHKGATISFLSKHAKPISLGKSIENDIVLMGADIEDKHLTIHPGSFIANKISVYSADGSFELEDGQIVNIGQKVDLPLPAQISFGDSALVLEREYDIQKLSEKVIKPLFLLIICILIGLAGSSLVLNQNYFHKQTISSSLDGFGVDEKALIAQNLEKQAKTALLLKEQIAKVSLENFLNIIENPDGTISVSGVIPESSMPAWRNVLQWYDGQPNMSYLINNVGSQKLEDFELSIKSVWIDGDARVVILSDGTMARIGDIVQGGWQIKNIDDDKIAIHRSGQTMEITF